MFEIIFLITSICISIKILIAWKYYIIKLRELIITPPLPSQNHRVVANCDVTSASSLTSLALMCCLLMGKQTVIIVCRCFGICWICFWGICCLYCTWCTWVFSSCFKISDLLGDCKIPWLMEWNISENTGILLGFDSYFLKQIQNKHIILGTK